MPNMSEREVHKFFVESRWGKDGVQICPGCGTIDSHYWVKTRRQWRCKDIACGRSFSVTSDTKFADHKLPLKKLLKAFVIFANNVKGISASALARTIGDLRSLHLHKLVAEKIRAQPSLFEQIRERLERRLATASPPASAYMVRWLVIFDRGIEHALREAVEDTEQGQLLRSATPFAGVLTDYERSRFLLDWAAAGKRHP
jgi:hypothetical protein